MRQLTVSDLWEQIKGLDDYDVPVVIVGERQKAVSAQIACQTSFEDEGIALEPVALLIQLIPVSG